MREPFYVYYKEDGSFVVSRIDPDWINKDEKVIDYVSYREIPWWNVTDWGSETGDFYGIEEKDVKVPEIETVDWYDTLRWGRLYKFKVIFPKRAEVRRIYTSIGEECTVITERKTVYYVRITRSYAEIKQVNI